MKQHEETHVTHKPYGCRYCTKRFTRLQVYKQHEQRHVPEKPYRCRFCTYTFVTPFEWTRHEQRHSNTRLRRHKYEEARVCMFLSERGVTLQREMRVDFLIEPMSSSFPSSTSGDCKGNTSSTTTATTFCKIDIVLNLPQAWVLWEVDEEQHQNIRYTLPREMSRMKRASCSLQQNPWYNQKPLVWIRFNPHAFTVNGKKSIRWLHRQRLERVWSFLQDFKPTQPVSVVYCFYDSIEGTNQVSEPVIRFSADMDLSFYQEYVVACIVS